MKKLITGIALFAGALGFLGIPQAMHSKHSPKGSGANESNRQTQVSPSGNSQSEQSNATVHLHSSDVPAIEGRVVNGHGNPVEGIAVVAARFKGTLRMSRTNSEGYFSIKGVPPGMYEVFAKEEDGPTCPTCTFYSGGLPSPFVSMVNVLKGETPSSIVIQAAPKLGKLKGRIYDAKTNAPLIASRIKLRRTDNPDYSVETGPDEEGFFNIPVPPVAITIEVNCSGYGPWTYVNTALPVGHQAANSLRLRAGESSKLQIGLRKTGFNLRP